MSKNLKITNNIAFILLLCVFFALPSQSQVTIGSLSEPLKGSLLDLKESDELNGDANATKGIVYPRVSLTNLNELYPMLTGSENNYPTLKSSHTGLTVYNVNTATPFEKGLYTWDGTKWIRMGNVAGAKNGLSLSGSDTIKLGGVLEENTTVDLGDNNLIFPNSNGMIGIGTDTPNAMLDVNGITAVSDSLIANGKLVLKSVSNAASNADVAQLAVDNGTGEVFAIRSGDNSKLLSYIQYTITCKNPAPQQRDWIEDFDTQIPHQYYTVFVVGSEFEIVNNMGTEVTTSGLKITTPGTGTPTFGSVVVEAKKNTAVGQNPTWRLKADYKYSSIADTALYGRWTIHCMIINKTVMQQLPNINREMSGTTWVESSIPNGL